MLIVSMDCVSKYLSLVFVSMVVSFSDTYSEYNDLQCLDKPRDMVNGVSSVADHAMNSSAAINDNRLNTQRQLHRDGCVNLYQIYRFLLMLPEG